MIELDIVERLRGKVRVPVNDGAGLLDGKDYFERTFPTSKAAMEAADEIEKLRAILQDFVESYDIVRSGWNYTSLHHVHDRAQTAFPRPKNT